MANNYDITQKLQAIADAITQGGGGGGTTVIANPSGTPTDTLNTIQIGSTIYDIAGSGGSGGGVTSNILYSGNAYASIINLNYDMFNYDLINVLVADGNGYTRGFAFSPSELLSGQTIGFDNTYGHIWYVITSGTVLTASAQQNFFIKDIIGFRSSSGALPELISEDFDPTLAYTIGDYCIYDNTLYKFTSAKSAGAWDNTKVSDTTVGEELTTLNSNMTPSTPSVNIDTTNVSSGSAYCRKIGRLVILNCQGLVTPANGKRLMYNLPIPDATVPASTYIGGAVTLMNITTNGELKMLSVGTTTANYFALTICYVSAS